ncbi:hypothetical protein OU792_13000 [Algoriphagus sp. NF]|nr:MULTISPECIES: hypothetical protein [Algoriphagus]MDE0560910.1 hypothetical protein [Algoriphagus sp. NF]
MNIWNLASTQFTLLILLEAGRMKIEVAGSETLWLISLRIL